MGIQIDEFGHIIRENNSPINNGHNEGRNSGSNVSFEDSLRRDTPTQAQIANRERSLHEEELRRKARNAVNNFKSLCKETANSGNHSCWSYAMSINDLNSFMWVYWSPIRSVEPPYSLSNSQKIDTYDAPHFVDLISEELKREGFSSAQVYIADIKANQRKTFAGLFAYHADVSVAKGFIIKTSW